MKNLALSCLIMCAIGYDASAQPSTNKADIAELKSQYAKAPTEAKRLLTCIEAINRRLICKGCDLETINQLFNAHFSTDDHAIQGDDKLFNAVVPLRPSTTVKWDRADSKTPSPLPTEENPPSATAISGWRLEFKYDAYGKVRSYYLSNATQAPMGF
ncbi:hypothetical protein [Lysobacter enzymogenes]|uniref:hypothetical protein n=1 Tax=Lysobacter enzymogenes TaxID=69 RepID=UPI001AF20E76|nr:hypothetical protein [Lysobacter enzymogenes]QQQ00877.1 hypothetical protein JHW41_22895 [Lysobacter enzymogenes]